MMNNDFLLYVKEQIKDIPCSIYFNLIDYSLIKEEEFILHINKKYQLSIINFEQSSHFNKEEVLNECTYHFKVNNQLYMEYHIDNVINGDLNLIDITIYSNNLNSKELISFSDYIDEYIKNKNN